MKVEVKQAEGLKRELAVEIPPETVKDKIDKKFDEVRRSVTLKGFRKGKAPLDMIRSMYAEQVKADVVDELIQSTYPEAIKEKTLQVASQPKVTALNFTDNGGFHYTAQVEVFPEIEKINLSGLKVNSVPVEATDVEVTEAIEGIRKRLAEQRRVTRAATSEDVVTADLKKLFDPKLALRTDFFENSEIDLANPVTVKEFREQIPGMSAGETKDIEVRYPEDYSDSVFAGAVIRYRCTVKEVRERVMPELDDAFAKSTKLGETMLELRMRVRGDIQRHKEDTVRRAQKRQLVAQISEKNPVPIPEGLLDEYLESVAADIKRQSGSVDEAALKTEYRDVGVSTIRWDMIWHKIAEQEKVEVLAADTENWIRGFAERNGMTPEQATEALNRSGKARSLRESMLEEKVMELLLSKASVEPAKG